MRKNSPAIPSIERVFPTPLAALSLSPAPSFKLKYAAQPSPSSNAKAIDMVTSGNATLVAAFPKKPTPCPMNIWSTMLYSEFTTSDITQGIANFIISFPMFSVSKGFFSSSYDVLFSDIDQFSSSCLANFTAFCMIFINRLSVISCSCGVSPSVKATFHSSSTSTMS